MRYELSDYEWTAIKPMLIPAQWDSNFGIAFAELTGQGLHPSFLLPTPRASSYPTTDFGGGHEGSDDPAFIR